MIKDDADNLDDHEFIRCQCETCRAELIDGPHTCAVCCQRRRSRAERDRVDRFKERLAVDSRTQPVTALDESLIDLHRTLDALRSTLAEVSQRAETLQRERNSMAETLRLAQESLAWERLENAKLSDGLRRERMQWAPDTIAVRRVAQTLAAFYRAPISMSSVQPLLTLAEELCPELLMIRAAFEQAWRLFSEWRARRRWDAAYPTVWRF